MPGPDWEFELPDQAPWPHPVAGVTTLPLSSVQLWPAGALVFCACLHGTRRDSAGQGDRATVQAKPTLAIT